MAEIVVGIATSHTPQLSMGADMWRVHSDLVDHMLVDMEARTAQAPPHLADELDTTRIRSKYDESQAQIAVLAGILDEAAPDVVVVFGDDHREVFDDGCSPGLAVYCADEVWDRPTISDDAFESQKVSEWAYHGPSAVRYPTAGALARHLTRTLASSGFDPAAVTSIAPDRTLGHAFTFIKRRLAGTREWAILPIWLNAFYGPNVPSAARCLEVGRAVRAAIESWPGDERVAIVASGGLSHYEIDEDFDRSLLDALEAGDDDVLANVPDKYLESGSGEIRMWIGAAGALGGLSVSHRTYIPGYRSAAGTGVGLGFVAWT